MNKEWGILHLTDFHIADANATEEHLREGFFREYIDDLVRAIREHGEIGGKAIDAIVITGDFVDRGNLNNFSHAEKIIQHLCEKLGISTTNVFMCNGNHDIDRNLETTNDHEGARKEYKHFCSTFGNRSATKENSRFSLVTTDFQTHMLLIDSTIGSNGVDRPGIISATEIDDIMAAIRSPVLGQSDLLVVASHHPTCPYVSVDAPFDESNTNWREQHLWENAYPLYSRLISNVESPVLWLSGDIHRPAHVIEGSMQSVVTGRFGTATNNTPSQIKRQGRVLFISSAGESQSWLCEFVPPGHTDQAQLGHWTISEQSPETHTKSARRTSRSSAHLNTPQAVAVTSAPFCAEISTPVTSSMAGSVQLLSELLQDMLLHAIANERLYSLGRYSTSEFESTLAWIPMGSLLDQGELLSSVITKMTQWVKKQLIDEEAINPVIIGVDSWGAILASQITAMTGIRNYCVAGRVGGITHSASERIRDTVQSGVVNCDLIILVSDVIGTGKSLNRIHDELSEKMSEEQKQKIKWSLLSVICDEDCQRENNLNFAYTNATACKDLRMPILRNDQLPNESVLPADISFIRR